MRRLLVLAFALVPGLIALQSTPADAREDRCDRASDSCIDRCNRVYSNPDRVKACWGRCADARAQCKGWTSGGPTSHGPVSGDNPPKRGPVWHPPPSGGTKQPPSGGTKTGVTPPANSGTNAGDGGSTTIYKKH